MIKKSKRAQEEMVGFALIVVIVAVIGVIFLGISLSNRGDEKVAQKSYELASFLSSISYYTTDCENPETDFQNLEELIVLCSENGQCSDGAIACEVLSETLKGLLNSAYNVEKGSAVKYYKMWVFYGEKADADKSNYLIKEIWKSQTNETETCPGVKLADYQPIETGAFSEQIKMQAEVCEL